MTLEELYGKVMADDGLKAELLQAVKAGNVVDWAKAQGVDATRDELVAYARTAMSDNGVGLTDDQVSEVAGGYGFFDGLNTYLGLDD